MNYDSSSVLITGASRGIGREIAIAFASRTDHPLLLVSRNELDLMTTRKLCKEAGGSKAEVLVCDLTNPQEVESLQIPEHTSAPGILINNAGSYLLRALSETSYPEFLNQIQANLFAAVHTTNRFLGGLKSLDRGLIINICSVGALVGLKESGAYSASKHALLGYTRSLRQELKTTNIGVTAINLGQTESTSWEGSDTDRRLLIDPKDIARLIVLLTQFSPRTLAEEITMKPQHGRVPSM